MAKEKEGQRRKWILGLGFSEAEADSFIENVVPNWKIEALAEVLHKPEPEPEAKPESVVATEPAGESKEAPALEQPEAEALAEGEGFGDYLCPECKVTHRAGSKIHKRHLKLIKG